MEISNEVLMSKEVCGGYLPTEGARGQLALHPSVIGRVHPQQEVPAAGEGDGQRVEDLPGVDAGRRVRSQGGLMSFWFSMETPWNGIETPE